MPLCLPALPALRTCLSRQEYARAKHAGNASFDFEATLAEHLRDEQDRRSRRRGYRAEETAAALQAVAEYGEMGHT